MGLEGNQTIKSGIIQSIGGYYALIVGLIVGISLTPQFIKSVGDELYGHYASWQVNAAFLYSFFPSSGRLVLLQNIQNSKGLGYILLGGLAALLITIISLIVFDTPIMPELYLLVIVQFIIYLSDQLRSWLQNINEGQQIATSVVITRTVHLLILVTLYPDYSILNFIMSLVIAEIIGLSFIIVKVLKKRVNTEFASIKIIDYLPYYFESNANKALAESFLKSQGIFISEIKFGSMSLIYRLNETVSRVINIPINALTVYFIGVKDNGTRRLNQAVWAALIFGVFSLFVISEFQYLILNYFNLSEPISIKLIYLIIGAITMSLLRPVIMLKMTQIGQRKSGLYFSFIELCLFWCLIPINSYSVLLAPTILYSVLLIRGLIYRKHREIGIFLIPILCFKIVLLLLVIQKQATLV